MKRFRRLAMAIGSILLAAPALAQPSGPGPAVEVNPYVGALVLDDSELQDQGLEANYGPIVGARLGVALGDDWLIEGSYGYASVTVEPSEFQDFPDPDVETDLAVHVIHGAVGYRIGTDVAPTELVLSAGAGGMWLDPDVGETEGDFLVTLGAGFIHPVNDWIDFKGDVKDHVTFCSAPERAGAFSTCSGDEALNHFEISGGLQFYVY